ncbi:hypothetical protein BDR22DRAFT_884614 [Usnea florida]
MPSRYLACAAEAHRGSIDEATYPVSNCVRLLRHSRIQRQEPVKADGSTADEITELDWYAISLEGIFQRLCTTSSQGVSPEQIDRKIKEYGKNVLCFGSILLTGAIICFVSWKLLGQPPSVAKLALAIVLVAVFNIQAAFNTWHDWFSSRVMASIMTTLPEHSTIIRGWQLETGLAPEILPGDVLLIKIGNKLPVDVRFVEVDDGRFDRSVLTGESLPICGSVNSTDVNYLDTRCVGLQGTCCVSVSPSFATSEPYESHAMHMEVAVTVGGLSHP